MLKAYKSKGGWYYIIDLNEVHESLEKKLDGQFTWRSCRATRWNEPTSTWEPEHIDHQYCVEELREIPWLEILVMTGQSERQALWEHKACFEVPNEDI